jgi:hypothetical protein
MLTSRKVLSELENIQKKGNMNNPREKANMMIPTIA